MTGADTNTHHG